ncbi:MAG: HlyD family secretion protein, partial [Gemmatimonadaceae bacterium]
MSLNYAIDRATCTRLALTLTLVLAACKKDTPPDTYGNFEAEETIVAAETAGQLQEFLPTEGQALTAKSRVGQVDTIQLSLERDQLV